MSKKTYHNSNINPEIKQFNGIFLTEIKAVLREQSSTKISNKKYNTNILRVI